MVTIKMMTLDAGPEGIFQPGAIRRMDKDQADILIAGGYAKLVKKEPKPVEPVAEKEPETETAMEDPGENAMMPAPRRRRKKKDA